MKKMISLVLTIAMMLSLAIPASAATITSTESNNTASKNVTARYTPSSTTTDEAKWGASATSLTTGSGTLAQALAAAKNNSSVKYIQLQTNVTATSGYDITGGKFTLDLNGKTISSSGYTITIGDNASNSSSGIEVTFTDSSSGGKVETTRSNCYAILVYCGKVTFTGGEYIGMMMSYGGEDVPYAEVIINDGSFKYDGEGRAVTNDGGKLTVNGGSFSGSVGDICVSGTTGVVTVNGGTFSESFDYSGGKLDLSNYNGTNPITDLVVRNWATSSVTVSDDTIKLPEGYAFYESDDADKTTVTTLESYTEYAIKSTSGSTTDEATITGVTVTIDGTEYSSMNTSATNPAKITPDTTSVKYTITGTNLDKLTDDFALTVKGGVSIRKTAFTASPDGTTATCNLDPVQISAWLPNVTTPFEVTYTLDGESYVNTGVYYVYEAPATITGVSIKVGETTYTSGQTVTLTPTSGNVTLIVTGTNLKNGTDRNAVTYASGIAVNMDSEVYEWTVNDEGTEASKTVILSQFENCTSAFELQYSNDGWSTWTNTGIYVLYQSETTSVEITWGNMTFTYSDEQVNGADKGWTCDTGANKVTVENKGTVSVKAEVSFTKSTTAENITNVSGTFDKSEATLISSASASGSAGTSGGFSTTATFTLTLTGKPDGALDGATIGSVTVTITKASDSNAGGIT